MLSEAHRRRLVHEETIQAYTTAAVINYSLGAPEQGVKPLIFIPHYKGPKAEELSTPKITSDELIDWQTRVANLSAELKQGKGPMLDEIRAKPNG